MSYSSPFASKELQNIEKKKSAKYPTLKAAKAPSVSERMQASARRFAKLFKSPYDK